MTDRQTDYNIQKIYEISEIKYFDDSLRYIIEDAIKELHSSHPAMLLKLRINHLDRAILKYRQAKEKTCIYNTKQYFKACIRSAIIESGLDDLAPLEWD